MTNKDMIETIEWHAAFSIGRTSGCTEDRLDTLQHVVRMILDEMTTEQLDKILSKIVGE